MYTKRTTPQHTTQSHARKQMRARDRHSRLHRRVQRACVNKNASEAAFYHRQSAASSTGECVFVRASADSCAFRLGDRELGADERRRVSGRKEVGSKLGRGRGSGVVVVVEG